MLSMGIRLNVLFGAMAGGRRARWGQYLRTELKFVATLPCQIISGVKKFEARERGASSSSRNPVEQELNCLR